MKKGEIYTGVVGKERIFPNIREFSNIGEEESGCKERAIRGRTVGCSRISKQRKGKM